MALTRIALLLFICAKTSALTSETLTDDFHSVIDVQARGDVCKDCTQIFELVVDLISEQSFQKKITDGLDKLCSHLPPSLIKACKDDVNRMLPVAITFVATFMKPADVCKMIGLCSSDEGQQEKLLQYLVQEAVQSAATAESGQPSSHCSFCIFLVKTLDKLLPKDRTEEAVIHLLEEICRIMPSSHRKQCESVISTFSKTILDAILSYASPQAVCSLLHQCRGQGAPLEDPCTLPSYRCSDVKTALRCGTLFYCQKFEWNDSL